MSPAALGNGTLPRGPLHIPERDDSWDPCLPSNCTLRCPRLPVSPPSLITHCASIVGLELRTGNSVSYQSYSGKELADFRLSLATGTSLGDRLRRGSNGALRPLARQSRRASSPLVAASRLPPAQRSL